MAKSKTCPICGSDMEYEEADPDTGILVDGWSCVGCEHFEAADPADLDDYDLPF